MKANAPTELQVFALLVVEVLVAMAANPSCVAVAVDGALREVSGDEALLSAVEFPVPVEFLLPEPVPAYCP
jgi:hypothetical protein